MKLDFFNEFKINNSQLVTGGNGLEVQQFEGREFEGEIESIVMHGDEKDPPYKPLPLPKPPIVQCDNV